METTKLDFRGFSSFSPTESLSLICHHQLLLFKQGLVFENNPPSIDEIVSRQAAARLCQNLFEG